MEYSIITGLLNNVALLLVMGFIFDILNRRKSPANQILYDIGSGIIIGCISVVLMTNPIHWANGVIFDTRTILIGLTGLFFGTIPTVVAMAIASVYRFTMGGGGIYAGVVTIVLSGSIGLLWSRVKQRRSDEKDFSYVELLIFGFVVHVTMIFCMLLLPQNLFLAFMRNLAIPVVTVYPVSTALLGKFLCNNLKQKRMERDLAESEERFRTLIDETPFGVAVIDPKTLKVAHFNPAACKNLGYEPAEFARLGVVDFEALEDIEQIKRRVAQVLQHGSASFESLHRTKNGELRNVMIDLKLITMAGKPVIHSIYRDITESKQKQRLLELYQYALHNANDQIFLTDRTSHFIFANNAACASLGYTPAELTQMCVSDIDPFMPAGAWEDHWHELSSSNNMTFEASHRAKDGSVHPVEMSLNHIIFGDSEYIIAIARDLTERKKQEHEKLEMEKQLLHTQKLESLGVLAGGIAHDFNNILMSIIGNSDLALMRIAPESPITENLHAIEEAAMKAADLSRQMLAYSGKGMFVIESVDMNRMLEEMLHMLKVSISKKAIIRFNPAQSLPSICADATQLRQVIMNLVINASEAIGDRSGIIAINTGWMECDSTYLKNVWLDNDIMAGTYVYLEVSDTGCGMDGETISKIFDPFFTTKFTGRGLGMAAVQGIVRGHKGSIKVYSEVGKGTSFKILLPANEHAVHNQGTVAITDDWQGAGKVLLVDDEESIQATSSKMLRELGYDVVTAWDGKEAIELFRTTPDIALVLLDLTMPHMDGEQCFRELKALNPAVRVIMSSGYSEMDVVQRFAGKGLAGFIQKPYRFSELKHVLKEAASSTMRDPS